MWTPVHLLPLLLLIAGTSKTALAILNCLIARQLCFEDPSCSAILEIIPRVCGPELVACSTVTVTKCQAALRTLQAFPFFKPTCLCREPHVDPECSSFRDFLWDHPCIFVHKKEKDPYPVDALPTCNHALAVCQQQNKCIKLFDDFKSNCKVRDGKCRMEDRDMCHEAWTRLRLSPMFGCICPNNHMKKRCDKIFTVVNHNPCVVKVISPGNGTSFDIIESQLENPLVGIKGPSQKDINVLRQELQGIPSNENSLSLDREDAEPRSTSFTHYPPGNANGHSSSDGEAEAGVAAAATPRNFTFQSTCHLALELCANNYSCRTLLQPILDNCDLARCEREPCMKALQNFYRKAELRWSLEIAFCLCKKTDNKQDECLVAQEKLHPVCAQRVEGSAVPTCHSLAEYCRLEGECRSNLEYYEQSCAVDSLTKKCAGPPSECRKSMLGILGTELRSNCACKGTDFGQLYDCLGWQRLLWVNPCVVESQKDFHTKRASHLTTTTTTTTTTTVAPPPPPPPPPPSPTHPPPTLWVPMPPIIPPVPTPPPPYNPITTAMIHLEVGTGAGNGNPQALPTEPSIPTTPAPPPTTTLPPRYCVVQRPRQSDQKIAEGKGKRLYRDDEPECSELCQCNEGETLICNTICVERAPCKTDFAFYNHAAPAYQAFRGRCLCYSGRFICMRPIRDSYKLPEGVFLFLGYSETDEALLKPHSNLTVRDAVMSLEDFMRSEIGNKTGCTLALYNVTSENVILVARLGKEVAAPNLPTPDLLMREKEACEGPLQDISNKINTHHPELHSHLLLSIFKLAEVEVKVPERNGALASARSCQWTTTAAAAAAAATWWWWLRAASNAVPAATS